MWAAAGPRGARRVRREAAAQGRQGPPLPRPARRRRSTSRAPGSSSRSELTTATRFGPALDAPLDELVGQHAGGPAGRGARRRRPQARRSTCPKTLQPAAGVPGRRRLPARARCPTTCSSGTTPPGSTTACRSTRWPSRPASGRRSTPGWSATSTRCSATPTRRTSTTATTAMNHDPANCEGGDILVIGNGAVMVGMGERTTPAGHRVPRPRSTSRTARSPRSSPSSCRRPARSCTSTPR